MPIVIYCITNKTTQQRYVGQTSRNLEWRWRAHCRPGSGCKYLRNAIQKDGPEAFDVEVIATCFCSQDDVDETERFWIKKYNTTNPEKGYNLTLGGWSGRKKEYCIRGHILLENQDQWGGCKTCNQERSETLEEKSRKKTWKQKVKALRQTDPVYDQQEKAKEQAYEAARWERWTTEDPERHAEHKRQSAENAKRRRQDPEYAEKMRTYKREYARKMRAKLEQQPQLSSTVIEQSEGV